MTDYSRIDICKQEFEKLRQIGFGTDGRVFNYKDGNVLKLYRENLLKIREVEKLMEREDKKYNKSKIKFKVLNKFQYYMIEDNDKIRIKASEAINRIIERQKVIKRTNLPKGSVYYNDNFAGCFYQKIVGIPIHKLTGLSFKCKYKLIESLLLDVEELLNNHIYHIDLGNSHLHEIYYTDDNEKNIIINGHSHILINPFHKTTNIIDLDGKSTFYTESYDFKYEQMCLVSLCTLLIEFLFSIDTKEIQNEDEIEFELLKFGLDSDTAYRLSRSSFNDFNEMKKSLKF